MSGSRKGFATPAPPATILVQRSNGRSIAASAPASGPASPGDPGGSPSSRPSPCPTRVVSAVSPSPRKAARPSWGHDRIFPKEHAKGACINLLPFNSIWQPSYATKKACFFSQRPNHYTLNRLHYSLRVLVREDSVMTPSMAKPRQESGMQFSPHKPHNVPERFAASVAKVCTTARYLTCRRRAKRHNSPAFFIDLLALG